MPWSWPRWAAGSRGSIRCAGLRLFIVGLSRSNRLYGAGKGMSIAGIVCGGVALILNILFIVAIYSAISTVH
jgi:hypothetical protein